MVIDNKKFDVVAVGRAYTDIIVQTSAEFLQEHQIPIDSGRRCSIAELKKIQALFSEEQISAGGPSANTVATVAALGGKAGFFGKVHHDKSGQEFLEDFRRRGVELCCPHYARGKNANMSATCLALLTGNERSFITNPGCSDYFSKNDFKSFNFSTAHFFLIEAYLLTSPAAKSAIIFAINCAEGKANIVVNLHGMRQWNGFSDAVRQIYACSDIIIGNNNEQAAFAQATQLLPHARRASKAIITTKGADGAEIVQNDYALVGVSAEPSKAFSNSMGAGDAFAAGYLFAQARGMDISDSMHQGIRTATAILEEKGARPTRSLTYLVLA